MAKKTKTIQQKAKLRLPMKPNVRFKDRKKEAKRAACRGKVSKCSKDYTY